MRASVVDGTDEDDAEQHLHGPGAADQQQQVVDDHRHRQDVDGVAPGQDLAGCGRASSARRPRARDAVPDARNCAVSRHVVHPQDGGAAGRGPGRGGEAAAEPVARRVAADLAADLAGAGRTRGGAMKLLRLAPTRSGRPSAASSGRPARSARFCAAVLPKPMPGSSTSCASSMPAAVAARRRPPRARPAPRPAGRRSGCPACIVGSSPRLCISTRGQPASATAPAELGVGERADVVDQVGAGGEGPPRHHPLAGVDRERRVGGAPQAFEHRQEPLELLLGRHRPRAGAVDAAAGPRRLGAEVEQVGARRRASPGRARRRAPAPARGRRR